MSNINYSSEFGKIEIDFDPSKYKTAAGAAKAFHKALCKLAKASGANPDYVFLWSPAETASRHMGECWKVCWEEGCFEWAIGTSDECRRPGVWHTEPYYSFDLGFYQD